MHAPTKQYNEEGKENVRRKRPRSVDETFSPKVIRTPTAEPPHKRPKRAAAGRIKNYADTYGDLRSPVNSVPLKQEYIRIMPPRIAAAQTQDAIGSCDAGPIAQRTRELASRAP